MHDHDRDVDDEKKVGKLIIMCDETLKTLRKLREYFFSEKILSFSE